MRRPRDAVLGLDLSTRASAGLVIPLNWGGDWLLTRQHVAGYKLDKQADDMDRARRNAIIADEFCQLALDYRVGVAWFESYAFGLSTSSHTLGELGGVVRHELIRAGILVRTANMGTARKLILGHVPRGSGKAKAAVFKTLKAAGMPFPTGEKDTWLDRADAFVSANLGLSEAGCYCFAQHAQAKAARGRRRG